MTRCGVKLDKLSFGFLNTFARRAFVCWVLRIQHSSRALDVTLTNALKTRSWRTTSPFFGVGTAVDDGNNGDMCLPKCKEDQVRETVHSRESQWVDIRREGLGAYRNIGQASLDVISKTGTQCGRNLVVKLDRFRQVVWDRWVKDELMSHGADLRDSRPVLRLAQPLPLGHRALQVSLGQVDGATPVLGAALANRQYCPKGLEQAVAVQQVEVVRAVPWRDASNLSLCLRIALRWITDRRKYHTTEN